MQVGLGFEISRRGREWAPREVVVSFLVSDALDVGGGGGWAGNIFLFWYPRQEIRSVCRYICLSC